MKKRTLIIILIFALLLTACSANNSASTATPEAALVEAVPTQTPATEAEAVEVPSEAPTPEPTEEPTVDSMQEKFAMAPEIDGLYKDIQEKDGIEKVVYLYEEGNLYGGEVGEYAGEFKKEVTMESWETKKSEEVGGIVLESNVIEYIMKDRISGFPEDSGLDVIPIPLDISKLSVDNDVKITFEQFKAVGYENGNFPEIININFVGKFPLVSMSRRESKYIPLIQEDGGIISLVNELVMVPGWEEESTIEFTFPRGEKMNMLNFDLISDIISINGTFSDLEVNKMGDDLKNFGDYLFDVTDSLSLMDWWGGIKTDLNNNMLRYKGVYIFIKVNE